MKPLAKLLGWLRRLAVLPIRFYRRFVTPYTPPSCRFTPTCSAYGEEAILRHGVLKGGLLTAWRILRCQPFSEPGPDPVPARGRWRGERGRRGSARTPGQDAEPRDPA